MLSGMAGNGDFTPKQKILIEGIKKGAEDGKTNLEIAQELGISEVYLQKLKQRAGLTKKTTVLKDWIAMHPEIDEWLEDLREGRAPDSTKVNMAGGVRRYCRWRGKEPIELLEEAEEDLKKPLREEGMTDSTVRTYMTAINSFFDCYEIILPKLSRAPVETVNDKVKFTPEMLKEVLSVSGARERAIFLTMFQTGLAANEIAHLRIMDLREVKDGITILRLRREKTGVRFVTFLGRDARNAIEAYLKVRNEGNLIPSKPELSKGAKVQSDEDYLFVTFNSITNEWSKINTKHIARYILMACRKLGWITEGQRFNKWRPHALRAGFSSILENAGIPKNRVDFLLSHKPNPQDKAYFENNEEELFKNYKSCEHLLSVSELDKVPDTKYEELRIELHKRNGHINALEGMVKELGDTIEAMKAKEDERAPYDETMGELMQRLLNNPEMRALIKKELETFKK
jgi:integrase